MDLFMNITALIIATLGPFVGFAIVCITFAGCVRWILDIQAKRRDDYVPTLEKDGYILTETHGTTKVRRK